MKSGFSTAAVIGICITAAVVAFCNHSQPTDPPAPYVDPAVLLPAGNEVPGWILGTSLNCFGLGIASDTFELFDIIDGPGEPFAQNGFVNGAFQTYLDTSTFNTADTVALCLQIFNQSTKAHARSIYTLMGNTYTPYIAVNNLGDMARMDTAMTNIILEAVWKNYYIRLMLFKRGPATDARYEQALQDFCSAIIRRINAALPG
jgi:hypothetical protein